MEKHSIPVVHPSTPYSSLSSDKYRGLGTGKTSEIISLCRDEKCKPRGQKWWARQRQVFIFFHRWARSMPSLFSLFPESTDIILFLLPVIFGSVCSDLTTVIITATAEFLGAQRKLRFTRFVWNLNDRWKKKLLNFKYYIQYSPTWCATFSLSDKMWDLLSLASLGSKGKIYASLTQLPDTPVTK